MKLPSGPELARKLAPHFPVGTCTQKRSGEYAGSYVVDFYYPGWNTPVLPAEQLASELVSHLSGNIRIVKTYQVKKEYVDDPFVMCSTVILQMDAVPSIPIPRLLMLPAPRIVGLLTAGQVAAVVTRYAVGQPMTIPGTQRWSRVLEVDLNKTEPFYRMRLMEGIEYKWYSETALAESERLDLARWDERQEAQFVAEPMGKAA